MLVAVLVTVVVAVALVAAVVLALPPQAATGVARSLELVRAPLEVPGRVPLAERSAGDRLGRPFLRALAWFGGRITPVGTPERLRRRMDLAGNVAPWDMDTLLVGKALGTLVLGGVGLLVWSTHRTVLTLLAFGALLCFGYWLMDLLLYNAGAKRQEALRRAAPDAFDMLTVCVEAGLGFDAALAQVAENTRGPLAAEFARVLKEMQLGQSRIEAFADLARRTDAVELKNFVAALTHADRLGVPVAGVLREQAGDLRVRRRQRAEERAQKVPVKIVFPLLFCIFPVVFVVVVGPGAIKIMQAFFHG